MIFRGLDANGDWQFGQGLQSYANNEAAVGLNIKTNLLCFLGNCYFDMLKGLNWFVYFGAPGQQQAMLLSIQALILSCYGVVKILSLSVNPNTATRNVVITYNIQTIYSPSYQQTLQVSSPQLLQ